MKQYDAGDDDGKDHDGGGGVDDVDDDVLTLAPCLNSSPWSSTYN